MAFCSRDRLHYDGEDTATGREKGMEADLGSRIQESRMEEQEVVSGYKTAKPTTSGHSSSTKIQPLKSPLHPHQLETT